MTPTTYLICEDKTLEKEINIWTKFYMLFNDANERHCFMTIENLFADGSLEETAESFRSANFKWIRELFEHGFTVEEILKIMPDAEEYIFDEQKVNEPDVFSDEE